MKPYGSNIKWHKENERRRGQCSAQSFKALLRLGKKRARAEAKMQIINETHNSTT